MRQIDELPEHETFSRDYRSLVHERGPDGIPSIRRQMKPENPETILLCGQVSFGLTNLSRGVFMSGEWRISCKSGQDKFDFFGVARNRDEALAATMDAADVASGSLSAGRFGQVASRYQSMLEERATLLRRDDVERATEATPMRQVLPSSRRWKLHRRLYHSAPDEESITLSEHDNPVPVLTLIGTSSMWSAYVRSWNPNATTRHKNPVQCAIDALPLFDECSGHERLELARLFSEALDGFSGISDATRHFGCKAVTNPFTVSF